MKRLTMLAMAAAPLALAATATSVSAAETYHGFAVQEHYVIQGGAPASFDQAASNPLSVFRSELAYANFRAHLASFTGGPVTDGEFRRLMQSDRVRLVDCVSGIDTSGVTDSGRFGWHYRACYSSPVYGVEQLIQYRLPDGRWVTVASLWCWNPVRGQVPEVVTTVTYHMEQPPAPPAEKTDYSSEQTSGVTNIDLPSMGSTVLVIGLGNHRHNDDCPPEHQEKSH